MPFAKEYVPVVIGGFTVDAIIEEVHSYDCEVTTNPIEQGGLINDHIRLMPIGLNLECVVSDTPIGAMETVRSTVFGPIEDPESPNTKFTYWSDEAHVHFKKLREKREPFSVVTSLQTYDNMVIERYTPTRKAGDGYALRFQLVLRYLNIVTNERTTVRVSSPNTAKKQPLGSRPTQVPPEDKTTALNQNNTSTASESERAAAAEDARRSKNSILGNLVEDVPDWFSGVF